mmetsp:Transcript_5737/g.6579  ORF Transcript_5737/g.6579 Transcript_5737/m.6579 type:complete len:160 (+) Transcript_5737:304-783(+)|eukprot:CAMPEP_0197860918 /NCGR_PEP_ID=MMETSP1438-20131217/36617_1 /TAXON_ID=1461541 /ORGANISM="Pterosperma sp., Strain CCMP1384" /LENGTH=159 /DNA_ID=CAMNT_0043477931 /DNA_START=304 /DNA_END=783 /DNA_ORIENTATION=-
MGPPPEEEEAPEEPAPPLEGTFQYHSGATYEGQYILYTPELEEGAPPPEEEIPPTKMRQGKGKFVDGDYSYEGDFEMDEFHGQGIFKYASGAVYEGAWEHNKYCGQGKYTWPNGTWYDGAWQENKMHGAGLYKDTEGHEWRGEYENGAGPGLVNQLVQL